MSTYLFTSESVSEGHPDKVCDFIADSVLDACLAQDANSHVACEVLAKDHEVVVAGELKTRATLDIPAIVREAVQTIGYTHEDQPFRADRHAGHIPWARSAAITRQLRLTEPLFRRTTNYGHFGKRDLPWEQ